MQEASPDAGVKVVTCDPEPVVHSPAGDAGGCGSFLSAVEEVHGSAVGRSRVEMEAVDDEDDDEEGGGDVVVEVPDDAAAPSP